MKLTMWRVVVVLNMHTTFRDSSLFPTKVLISLKAFSNIARLFCGLSFCFLYTYINRLKITTQQRAHKLSPLYKKKSNSAIIWRRVYVRNGGLIIEFIFLSAGRNGPVTGNIEQKKQG